MPRNILLAGLVLLSLAHLMAKETASGVIGQIYSHGTIRRADHAFEAVVEVASEFIPNIHAGQKVLLDVRQGKLRGTVRGLRSPVEITIAIDPSQSKINLSRLQPGQAVIAVIQLEPECGCEIPELR